MFQKTASSSHTPAVEEGWLVDRKETTDAGWLLLLKELGYGLEVSFCFPLSREMLFLRCKMSQTRLAWEFSKCGMGKGEHNGSGGDD